ncbi:GNAT family N-acetyltransferase [Reichenbachiella agarivorans]|uniref:GNAT family N-acetyltransferase n=1 Tax=Reichenbachiella agarivorans TaxID=2979464 RepID=A0ABY6CTH5_9BACT|nr:GNAT family N-acetyltransferase [Reichenbachiella agarivorans]UXP33798.1 GNAT family N-acetyltransferase [Reichenbachiella agarivorans]
MIEEMLYNYKDGLESERLITRLLTKADIDVWEAYYLSGGREKYLLDFGGNTPKENARLAVERQLRRYESKTYGLQALIEKDSGLLIGQCGLLVEELDGETQLELGYQLFNDYWGKGYATEAARMFIDYGFAVLDATSIVAIINVDNISSQKVASRNAMKQEKQMAYMGSQVFVYRLVRQDWVKL